MYSRVRISALFACVLTIAACNSKDVKNGLSEVSAALDPIGTSGCLNKCMKMSEEAMAAAEAGDVTRSMELNQEAMACQSRCENGGGTKAAKGAGVGDNLTGCLAKCMEFSTKSMKAAEAGDVTRSMELNQEAMACQSRCESGGNSSAAAFKAGTGNNTTGCLAKCMEFSTKAMKAAEAGDVTRSMELNQEAMACQSRCN